MVGSSTTWSNANNEVVIENSKSQNRTTKPVILAITVLLTVAIVVVRYKSNPRYIGLGSDSGLFAYGGQQILGGAVLYQDVWDTKPPGVFYINAIALALGGGGPWSIWGFETIWSVATVVVLLLVLSYLFGWVSGSASTVLIAFTALFPAYVGGGNFTETWALLPQVMTLAVAVAFFRSDRQIWLSAAGILTGIAFLLKPTYVALGVTILVVAVVTTLQAGNRPKAWSHIGYFGVGFLAVLLAALAYWTAQNALGNLWSAVIRQNLSYVQEGLSVRSLYGTGRRFLLEQPMATLATLTAASLALFLARRELDWGGDHELPPDKDHAARRLGQRKILIAAFLALPLEIGFVAISGRNFGHYFLTPMPAMAVSIAYLFTRMLGGLTAGRRITEWLAASLALVGMLLVGWMLAVFSEVLPTRAQVSDIIEQPFATGYLHDDLERYVLSNTTEADSVLVWGYNPRLNYITGRRAPSRYLFHGQLFTPGPTGEERFEQFLRDLESDPPVLIMAQPQSQHAVPFFGVAGDELCPDCTENGKDNLKQFKDFVDQQYERKTVIEDWMIYRIRDEA